MVFQWLPAISIKRTNTRTKQDSLLKTKRVYSSVKWTGTEFEFLWPWDFFFLKITLAANLGFLYLFILQDRQAQLQIITFFPYLVLLSQIFRPDSFHILLKEEWNWCSWSAVFICLQNQKQRKMLLKSQT